MRKISASYIYAGNSGFLKNGILCLDEKGFILDIIDTRGKLNEEPRLEHYNGILCPGFVNAHCHLELSHMRGKIPQNTGLAGFVEKIIPGRKAGEDIIRAAIESADQEMYSEGIVAVGDICNTSDTFEVKSNSRIFYHSFIEIFGTSPETAQSIYRNGVNLLQLAQMRFSIKASITPHAPYSVGEVLFSLIRESFDPKDFLLSIHNQESASENDMIRNASGDLYDTFKRLGFDMSTVIQHHKNSFEWLREQLPVNARYLMVHNLYTCEEDIVNSHADEADIFWVLCPKSNYYIGGMYPGKFLMDRFPNQVCIGTDSLASNNKLSIIEEIYTIQSMYPEIPLSELLSWASINGARALGIDKWCGSFEIGKKPGVILIENADILNLQLKKESRVKVLV